MDAHLHPCGATRKNLSLIYLPTAIPIDVIYTQATQHRKNISASANSEWRIANG